MRRETARERALRRWFRYPVDVPFDARSGADVTDTPLNGWEFEYLPGHGPILVGETIPPEDEESRVNALSEAEFQAELAREQAEADAARAAGRRRPDPQPRAMDKL